MNDNQAVEQAEADWIKAFNRADVDAMLALYTRDVVLMPPGEPSLHGRRAVGKWIRAFFKLHRAKQVVENDEVQVHGTFAWLRGRFEIEIVQHRGGPFETVRGQHLVIWRLEKDGAWRAARDIWNLS
jgi:uncharacterized protein (TIGR02246 family)